jgi:PAS domain S-box-containing protein
MPGPTTDFEGMLDAVPGALVAVDSAGVIRYVNRQTELLFGYDREDLVGSRIETLVPTSIRPEHPAYRGAYFAHLKAQLQLPRSDWEGSPGVGRLPCPRGRHRDGTEFPVNISLCYIDTEDGVLAIAAVQDCADSTTSTDNKDLMIQLAAIVEHCDDAIIGGTLDGIITSWNHAAERIYGYTSGEIIGKSVEVLSPQGRTGEIKANLAKIRAGEHLDHFQTVGVRKDSSAIRVSLTISPIRDADGATVGASSIAHEVTT